MMALSSTDNCPTLVNASQADTDGDGLGDACELPIDNLLPFMILTATGTRPCVIANATLITPCYGQTGLLMRGGII